MRRQTASRRFGHGTVADHPQTFGSEQVYIRNYDHQWGYDLALEIVDADGELVFEDSYYLQPGQIETVLDTLPAGEYEISGMLDNLREEVLHCRIDDDPTNTVVIEMGNGALSLSEGLHG